MQNRFGNMNNNIISRIDEMSKKINELEQSIGELVKEAQEDPENDQQIKQWSWHMIHNI